jgi:hypothetical protein
MSESREANLATPEETEWVTRVLGVAAPGGGTGAGGADVIALWQDATKAIDGRLAGLARELRTYGDVDFNQLADKGVHQLLDGGETAALTGALTAYNAAKGDRAKAAAALRQAVTNYQSFLDRSELVEALDDNPFEVDVEIYTTLSDALRRIDGGLPKLA